MFGKRIKLTGNMKSAKQLGEVLGLSSQKVNILLKEKGFLIGEPNNYTVTKKGKKYSEERLKDNGYGGYAARSWGFIMWDEAILQELKK
jgi:biotin operon repressor